MGRTTVTYRKQPDPVSQAQRQSANFQQQRQAQASSYAAAKFNEWQQNAAQREQSLQFRNQILQSQAEMSGLKDREALYHQGEIDRQAKMYLSGMPVLREQLKQAGISPGDPRYAAEISAFAQHIPDAFTHVPEIQKRLTDLSKTDATAAEIAAKAKTLQEGLAAVGLHGTSFSSTAAGNFDVKATRPNEDLQKELKDAHGITRTQFETFNPNSAYLGTLDEKGNLAKNPSGNDIQFSIVKDGKASNISMSVPEFNRYKVAFGQSPVTPQAATQGTPESAPTSSATPVGIEVGTQRTINGQQATWDGQGWSAVQQ